MNQSLVDPALQRRLRRPDLRSGAGVTRRRTCLDRARHEPVPLQPLARQSAAASRTAGTSCPAASDDLCQARTGVQRVRGRHRQGRAQLELQLPLLQRGGLVRQPDQGDGGRAGSRAGIKLNLEGKAFGDVISDAFGPPCVAGKPCAWDMANWGGGWIYSPDFYPTGEEIFATGAGSNAGQYSNPTADKLIKATNTSSSLTALYTYENYTRRASCRSSGSPRRLSRSTRSARTSVASTRRTRSSAGKPRTGTSARRSSSTDS